MVIRTFQRRELGIASPVTLAYTPNHMIFSLAYYVKKKWETGDARQSTSAHREGRT
jgi:hypothetical protein